MSPLDGWLAANNLTLDDAALIQPTYCGMEVGIGQCPEQDGMVWGIPVFGIVSVVVSLAVFLPVVLAFMSMRVPASARRVLATRLAAGFGVALGCWSVSLVYFYPSGFEAAADSYVLLYSFILLQLAVLFGASGSRRVSATHRTSN